MLFGKPKLAPEQRRARIEEIEALISADKSAEAYARARELEKLDSAAAALSMAYFSLMGENVREDASAAARYAETVSYTHLDVYKRQLLTPYEAIATAVGGSVGFGNIAGVATAVTTGGPGAVFWMWLTAFLGMLIKQVEVSLAVYYRRTDENGVPYGGPTYYMERGLGEERHWGKWWLPLAFVFGIGIFSTFFISASTFTTSEVVAQSLGIPQAIAALIIVVILYVMIWGGVKKLGQILTKLVPIMSLSYLILGLAIIAMNYENILPTLGAIFSQAFTGSCLLYTSRCV